MHVWAYMEQVMTPRVACLTIRRYIQKHWNERPRTHPIKLINRIWPISTHISYIWCTHSRRLFASNFFQVFSNRKKFPIPRRPISSRSITFREYALYCTLDALLRSSLYDASSFRRIALSICHWSTQKPNK